MDMDQVCGYIRIIIHTIWVLDIVIVIIVDLSSVIDDKKKLDQIWIIMVQGLACTMGTYIHI